jgi:hypothetical protein
MDRAQALFQQLDLMSSFERVVAERRLSHAKEKNAQRLFDAQESMQDQTLKQRFQSTVPPFLKWPIWLTRPHRGRAPTTFAELSKRLGTTTASADAAPSRQQVTAITYRLSDRPYVQLKVTFTNGELGADDRRILVALSHRASVIAAGATSDEYAIFHDELAELVGDPSPGAWKRISLALWCLSGTYIQLLDGDPLVRTKGWSLNSFSLLPAVQVIPQGRRHLIRYALHPHAHEMLKSSTCTSFDVLRSLATRRRPAVESLYLLVFDVAQYTAEDHVDFSAASLHQRLGFCTYQPRATSAKTGLSWPGINRTLKSIAEETEAIAGFITGFERAGSGARAAYRFHLARGEARRIHTFPTIANAAK